MAILPIQHCLSERGGEIIGRMKSINPDIKIIGYQGLLGVSELYFDTLYVRRNIPYELDYYYVTRDHWAWTTTGDTLSGWPGSITLNPFTDGSLDYGFITDLVDLIEEYRQGRRSALDGIMHDYFMYSPGIDPSSSEGDIDLDANGVLFREDEMEKEFFLRWQIDFAREIRTRMGPDFIQVGNGKVPQENAELAGMINGIFYEVYPNMRWGITDRDGLTKLLENQREGYLARACGRTWSILSNDMIEYNTYFCFVSSLLAGCLYSEIYDTAIFTGWRIDTGPGLAESDLIIEGDTDTVMTFRRYFAGGEARISFKDYGGRLETLFIENIE